MNPEGSARYGMLLGERQGIFKTRTQPSETPSSFVEFHDVHAGVMISAVDDTGAIHLRLLGQ
jgi:hypothetical protein